MRFERAYIPVGSPWFSPFARWQGALAEISSLDLAVDVGGRALNERSIDPSAFGSIVLGMTIPQPFSFYGAPTVAARLGAPGIGGPAIAQACATSAACVAAAAAAVELGERRPVLVVTTDRTSNGPLLIYPEPGASGGAPRTEHWVLDNFRRDPWAGHSMLETAEFVAREESISREEIDDVAALRHAQYADAIEHGALAGAVVPVEFALGKRVISLRADSGIRPTSREALAELRPAQEGGRVSFGAQTHPADGTAGLVLCDESTARAWGRRPGVLRVLACAFVRTEKARMPKAPVAAARLALEEAGLALDDVEVVTTHNPFAVNDAFFARATGYPLEKMNRYGCSLVFGHPQGPTGMRSIGELALALEHRGGGVGLFTGCAAGDIGGAVLLRLDD